MAARGLAVLATEYAWAQRALNATRRRGEQARGRVLCRDRTGGQQRD